MRRRSTTLAAAFDARLGLALAGLLSLGSAALSALLAQEHALSLGAAICGAAHVPHCGWCAAAAAFAFGGLAALMTAARPVPLKRAL